MGKDNKTQLENQNETKVSNPVQPEQSGLETAVVKPIMPLQRTHKNISPSQANQYQRTIGNQAVKRLAIQRQPTNRTSNNNTIDFRSSLSPILHKTQRITQTITPISQPIIHRKVHKRYERQWADAIEDGYLSGEQVDQIRDLVSPLKGKADSNIKDVVSLSNWITKAFKNKTNKRKIQALLWLEILEIGTDNIADLKEYKTYLKSLSSTQINSILGIEESSSSIEELSISIEEDLLDFDNPPWESANGAVVKDSGHGGVVIVSFPNGKLVVKAAKGGGLNNEIFGSRLAQQLGMQSPNMRFAGSGESDQIELAVEGNGAALPAGRPYVVMDYVPGGTASDFAKSGQELQPNQINTLAMSIGRWFAFDVMIQEQDRFNTLAASTGGNGVNTANFMINSENINSGFVSIDQNPSAAGKGQSDSAFENITSNSPMFAFSLGAAAAKMIPGDVDAEEIGDIVMQSAQATLKDIGLGLTEEDVRRLAEDLDINESIIESVMRTVNSAREALL